MDTHVQTVSPDLTHLGLMTLSFARLNLPPFKNKMVINYGDLSHQGLLGLCSNVSCYTINYFFVFQL